MKFINFINQKFFKGSTFALRPIREGRLGGALAEFVAKWQQQQASNESSATTPELAALPGFGALLSTFGYALNAVSKKIERIGGGGGGTKLSAETAASAAEEQQNEGKNENLPPFARACSELEMKLMGQLLDGPDPVELVEHREV